MLIQTPLEREHVGFKDSIQQLSLLRNFWRGMNHHSQNKIADYWDFFYGTRISPISIFACALLFVFFLILREFIEVGSCFFGCYIKQFPLHAQNTFHWKIIKKKTNPTHKPKITQTIFLLINPKWNQCFLTLPYLHSW